MEKDQNAKPELTAVYAEGQHPVHFPSPVEFSTKPISTVYNVIDKGLPATLAGMLIGYGGVQTSRTVLTKILSVTVGSALAIGGIASGYMEAKRDQKLHQRIRDLKSHMTFKQLVDATPEFSYMKEFAGWQEKQNTSFEERLKQKDSSEVVTPVR